MRHLAAAIAWMAAALAALYGVRRGLRGLPTAGRRNDRSDRRGLLWTIAAGVAGVGFVGLAVLLSGVVANRASDPHWFITQSFFELATRQSVATHSLGVKTPPLDDPAQVLRGAGHFETGCAPCHGSPWNREPPIAGAMMPPPPYLPDVVQGWKPRELFYIVKHGIKFAGMPAWPAQERDDEVWSVVAFLLLLPEMDGATYRQLSWGQAAEPGGRSGLHGLTSVESPPAALTSCARCHGVDGRGRGNAAYPRLAGQREAYLIASLEAYASGNRPSGIMRPVAAGLQPGEIERLARWYAAQEPAPSPPGEDPILVAWGEALARDGVPERRIPSCIDCHGPWEHEDGVHPIYPRLAGQFAGYLELQLELFRSGSRGGTAWQHVMGHVGATLGDPEIRALAAWYASLPGE